VHVADVAARAGVSAGHLNYYFPSKTELLVRALGRIEEEFHQRVAAELQNVSEPWERLERLIELSASGRQGDWLVWFQLLPAASEGSADGEAARAVQDLDVRWRALMLDVIRYGCERGAFHASDPEFTALALGGAIDGLSIRRIVGSDDFDRAALLDTLQRIARLHLSPAG
jgi:AcrR family transcriptional regulator